jgi:hypothetical protein
MAWRSDATDGADPLAQEYSGHLQATTKKSY